uniref:Glycine N-acyltransferase-like protein n=1 Tax=Parastrongyloides trichosuri TaxID=131310 RepID=A0A0N4ZIG5_PARTI
MLVKEIERVNLPDLLLKVKKIPNLLTIYHSIHTEVTHLFPFSKHYVFEAECEDEMIYFAFRKNVYVMPFLFIGTTSNKPLPVEKLEKIFEDFFKVFPDIEGIENYLTIGVANLTRTYNIWRSKYFKREPSVEYPTYLYYMNTDQKLMVKEDNAIIPNDYYYDDNISAEDSYIINQTWQHAKKGDLEQTRAKLQCLPFACIKYQGKPVSFEMSDPSGFLNHQFTIEEHRRKGLGLAIEIEISKKAIALDRIPFKTVELYNKSVLKNSDKSKYWTRWNDANHLPVEFLFIPFIQ